MERIKPKLQQQIINKAGDHIALFLVSLSLLLIVFFAFMGYRFYEIRELFADALTMMDQPADRAIASNLIAIVFVFTTMIFMAHAAKLDAIFSKQSTDQEISTISPTKIILVIFALLINLFFWQPWMGARWDIKAFKLAACIMLASMDYAFAHLFNVLRLERVAAHTLEEILISLRAAKEALTEKLDRVKELKRREASLHGQIEQFTCPHCQGIYWPAKSINAHIGICKTKEG